jgi:hypothetical protein
MDKRFPRISLIALAVALVCGGTAVAQTTGGSTTTTTGGSTATTTGSTTTGATTTPSTSGAASSKLAASFADLAGSTENATALVNGLRTQSPITLTSASTTTTSQGGTTTFTPPTRPMGYGNIRIALSLARAELAAQGITNPTPQQLQGALTGTTSTSGTQTQGILQMRASGMGWGQIANSMGVKLGAVMSGHVPTAAATTASGTTSGTTTSTAGGTGGGYAGHGKSGSGIVTAGGGSAVGSMGHGNGAGSTTTSAGVMSAQGAAHGQGAGAGGGQGQGRGKP